jgi:hypothetical protein
MSTKQTEVSMPPETANGNEVCPDCGKPLRVMIGRSLLTLFRRRYWLVCEGALRRTMGRRIGACLNHWWLVRGVVKSMPGSGQVLLWELQPSTRLQAC